MSPLSTQLTNLIPPLLTLPLSTLIFSISFYPVPILISLARPQPSSSASDRSRPSISLAHLRSIFSNGSHFIPQVATCAAAGWAYLAHLHPERRTGFVLAALGCLGIGPMTGVMVRVCNGRLIGLDEKRKKLAKSREHDGDEKEVMRSDTEEIVALLILFERLNYVRAGLVGMGGVVGLWSILDGC